MLNNYPKNSNEKTENDRKNLNLIEIQKLPRNLYFENSEIEFDDEDYHPKTVLNEFVQTHQLNINNHPNRVHGEDIENEITDSDEPNTNNVNEFFQSHQLKSNQRHQENKNDLRTKDVSEESEKKK